MTEYMHMLSFAYSEKNRDKDTRRRYKLFRPVSTFFWVHLLTLSRVGSFTQKMPLHDFSTFAFWGKCGYFFQFWNEAAFSSLLKCWKAKVLHIIHIFSCGKLFLRIFQISVFCQLDKFRFFSLSIYWKNNFSYFLRKRMRNRKGTERPLTWANRTLSPPRSPAFPECTERRGQPDRPPYDEKRNLLERKWTNGIERRIAGRSTNGTRCEAYGPYAGAGTASAALLQNRITKRKSPQRCCGLFQSL